MIGFLNVSTIDTSGWVTLYWGEGAILCTAGCWAACLASTHLEPVAPLFQWWQPKMSLGIAKCPLGGRGEQKCLGWEPLIQGNQENNKLPVFILGEKYKKMLLPLNTRVSNTTCRLKGPCITGKWSPGFWTFSGYESPTVPTRPHTTGALHNGSRMTDAAHQSPMSLFVLSWHLIREFCLISESCPRGKPRGEVMIAIFQITRLKKKANSLIVCLRHSHMSLNQIDCFRMSCVSQIIEGTE